MRVPYQERNALHAPSQGLPPVFTSLPVRRKRCSSFLLLLTLSVLPNWFIVEQNGFDMRLLVVCVFGGLLWGGEICTGMKFVVFFHGSEVFFGDEVASFLVF